MFYKASLALLSLTLLAGCGASPASGLAASRLASKASALVDTSRHRKTVIVPADVMANVDDYMKRMHAKYDEGGTSVHMGVKLVASANNFKQKFEATMDRTNPRQGTGSQTFLLDEDAPSGELAFYLVVVGSVVTEAPNSLKMDSLPDFYVSNYGKNFQAVAK